MAQQYTRKRLWINGAFQARLLLRVAVYLLFFIIVVWHVNFVIEALPWLADINKLRGGLGGLYLECLAGQKPFLVALLVTVPVALYDLLKFSHRIAGPLFRCQKVMEAMAAGRPVAGFAARDGDHMPEFFRAFNALVEQWNARLGAAGRPLEILGDRLVRSHGGRCAMPRASVRVGVRVGHFGQRAVHRGAVLGRGRAIDG